MNAFPECLEFVAASPQGRRRRLVLHHTSAALLIQSICVRVATTLAVIPRVRGGLIHGFTTKERQPGLDAALGDDKQNTFVRTPGRNALVMAGGVEGPHPICNIGVVRVDYGDEATVQVVALAAIRPQLARKPLLNALHGAASPRRMDFLMEVMTSPSPLRQESPDKACLLNILTEDRHSCRARHSSSPSGLTGRSPPIAVHPRAMVCDTVSPSTGVGALSRTRAGPLSGRSNHCPAEFARKSMTSG